MPKPQVRSSFSFNDFKSHQQIGIVFILKKKKFCVNALHTSSKKCVVFDEKGFQSSGVEFLKSAQEQTGSALKSDTQW